MFNPNVSTFDEALRIIFFKKKSSSTEKSNITLHFARPSLLNNFNMYLNDK